jgi:hypothetical protein
MNKFFWGLIAINLALSACQTGKNNAIIASTAEIPSLVNNQNDYYNNAETNDLLFKNAWMLITYLDPEGQEINYSGIKVFRFNDKGVSFNDDFPNDCNSCQLDVDYETKTQLLGVKKGSFTSCTEKGCLDSYASIENNNADKLANEFDIVWEENMKYQIKKNNHLELSFSGGTYILKKYKPLSEVNLTELKNTRWQIVSYKALDGERLDEKKLKKPLFIGFDSKGYDYSPDCNSCSHTFKGFDTKNGTISWDKNKDLSGICTTMACPNSKTELPAAIISNGMKYAVEKQYLYLSDDKYKLKLRLWETK